MRLRLPSVAACVLVIALTEPNAGARTAAVTGGVCAKVSGGARLQAPGPAMRSSATTIEVTESCSSAQSPPQIDGPVTFIATIKNTGGSTARNVVATLTVPLTGPPGTDHRASVPRHPSSQCAPPAPAMVCTIGDLQPGLPFSVYFSVTPTAPGPLTSTVSVRSTNAASVSDQSSPVVAPRSVVRVVSVTVRRRSAKRFSVAGIVSVDTPFPDCVAGMPIALQRRAGGARIPLGLISTGPASNGLRAVAAARFAKVVTLLHPTGRILAIAVPKAGGDVLCESALDSKPIPRP